MKSKYGARESDSLVAFIALFCVVAFIIAVMLIHEFLVENPAVIYILIVGCIAMAAVLIGQSLRRPSSSSSVLAGKSSLPKWRHPSFYARQLEAIEQAYRIEPTRLLNREESKPLYGARDALIDLLPATRGWNVYAQASMGEFLTCSYRNALSAFNSKRVDLLICDNYGMPRLVIEHQGTGHINPRNEASDQIRNKVKRAVLKKAGIRFIETPAKVSSADAKNAIIRELQMILGLGVTEPSQDNSMVDPMATFAKKEPFAS